MHLVCVELRPQEVHELGFGDSLRQGRQDLHLLTVHIKDMDLEREVSIGCLDLGDAEQALLKPAMAA